MTLKPKFLLCLLALSTVAIATAASSYFTLANPATLGTHKLKSGEYEVEVKGDQATITNADGKSFKIPVKVEEGDKKFDTTTVGVGTKDGVDGILEIDLGGSKTKLTFAQ